MATYRIEIEFDITRRIGWSDEDLGLHIDDVFDRLHQAAGVERLDTDADLDTGRTHIRMDFASLTTDDPEHLGRATLGVAIRSCGGSHHGLLTFAEEAAYKPERNQWSGLRTPSWKVRQVTIAPR